MTSMDLLPRLKTATQLAMSPDKLMEDVLSHLQQSIEDAMLMGFAAKADDERFCVSCAVGQNGNQLKGLEFSIGEGYLGHVVATAQPAYWSNVSNDPRCQLFLRIGIYPVSVFCHPVFERQEIVGVFFTALSVDAKKDTLNFLELVAIMLGRQLRLESLEKSLQVRTMRLAALIELSQAIRVVTQVKNILYIILDMSLNLVQGPFTCIAFQASHEEATVELITRGIPRQKAAEYGEELAKSYIGKASADFTVKSVPAIRRMENVSVIECPLFVRDKVMAVLAVAVDQTNELEEFTQLVYVLSVIGGAALQRIDHEQDIDWARKIALIHEVSAFWSQEAHKHASEVQELAMAFTEKLARPRTEIQDIGLAALLLPYDKEFVLKALPDVPDRIQQILDDYWQVVKDGAVERESLSELGQILVVVDHYLQNHDIQTASITIELRERFERFLLHRRIESQQILLRDVQKPVHIDGVSLSALPITEQLTAREQEILQHLVTGMGNKEIAQTLFISEHTVKNHLTNIFQKLGVADRAQAIAFVLGRFQ